MVERWKTRKRKKRIPLMSLACPSLSCHCRRLLGDGDGDGEALLFPFLFADTVRTGSERDERDERDGRELPYLLKGCI